MPHFIGCEACPDRVEFICEDVPVNSKFMTLMAFDPSLSNKQLCYSILQNDYFGLEYNRDISPNGAVILKKKIDVRSLFPNTLSKTLNFTALLYYCNEDIILNKQVVTIYVKNVNNYPPKLITRVYEN